MLHVFEDRQRVGNDGVRLVAFDVATNQFRGHPVQTKGGTEASVAPPYSRNPGFGKNILTGWWLRSKTRGKQCLEITKNRRLSGVVNPCFLPFPSTFFPAPADFHFRGGERTAVRVRNRLPLYE